MLSDPAHLLKTPQKTYSNKMNGKTAKTFSDYTRLAVLTFFLSSEGILFSRRLLWRGPRSAQGSPFLENPLTLALIIGVFLFWYLIEITEFIQGPYQDHSPRRGYGLFLLRILPFLGVMIANPSSFSLLIPITFTVIAFYSPLYFRPRISVVFLITVLTLQVLRDFFPLEMWLFSSRMTGPNQFDIYFLIYKLMNSLLVWLIAFFWNLDKGQARENQILNTDLRRTQQQLRDYAEKVADTVVLEERNRLARDIHDSLGHNLTAAAIQLTKAERYFDREPETARRSLTDARNCIQEGMRDIREVLGTLNAVNQDLDIFQEVEKIGSRLPEENMSLELSLTGSQKGYNKAVILALYRIVQEGVTNIIKHAQARRISITLDLGEESAEITIEDDGCGFSPEELSGEGYGLPGLKNRISLVRGELSLTSAPGKGTVLQAQLPREPAAVIGGNPV